MGANRFYKIEQDRLFLEAEKISIFTSHGPTIGSYRESLLKEYIKRFLPKSLCVRSGFVSPNNDAASILAKQSRQTDVLIYEAERHVPLIESGDFSVVVPGAVLGCMEVKSTLTLYKNKKPGGSKDRDDSYPYADVGGSAYRWAGTLVDALENIHSIAIACSEKESAYFRGIIAFDASFDSNALFSALDSQELQRQLGIKHLNQLPIFICVIGKFLIGLFEYKMFKANGDLDDQSEFCSDISYYNEIMVSGKDLQYPLQFFTVYTHNQLCYLVSKKEPDTEGLFSAVGSTVKMRSRSFPLESSEE